MDKIDLSKISLDELNIPQLKEKNVEVFVLRLDKIHPIISGNKWFKLQFYLAEAKEKNKTTIVTMGGAWSNHIVATAAASKLYGFGSIGIIRGEEPKTYSSTLLQAMAYEMKLIFISRPDYKQKVLPRQLISDSMYFIDEGGYGEKGIQGASTILSYSSEKHLTHVCCATGTGTMLAGLANSANAEQKIIGINVLKNKMLGNSIIALLNSKNKNFQIIHDYDFGGYAKSQPLLIEFMNQFYRETGIPSDFVYTGKLFYAVTDLITKDFFQPGSKLLVIHSGGLQGNASLMKGTLIF